MAHFSIEGGHPLNGTITPSGNKNEALPALMTCLLTDEAITLHRMPKIRDVLTTCEILAELNVEVKWLKDDRLYLCAKHLHYKKPSSALCSKIRASILLIGPLLARFGKVELPLPGGDVIGARSIDTHFECIRSFGGELTFEHEIKGRLRSIEGSPVYLDEPSVTATSNAILLAVLAKGTSLIHNAACEPHIAGLCRLLNAMGAKISGIGSNKLAIRGVPQLKGAQHTLSPDFMEIGSFLSLGAITEGTITIEQLCLDDLRFILKTFQRIGIHPEIRKHSLSISSPTPEGIRTEISGKNGTIYSSPWPAFPTDLMSVAIVAATQIKGSILFHEKMFESRLFFTDKLIAMGANIVLCDPHRVVVNGPSRLKGTHMTSPDVRAGMALLIAALVAKGQSHIHNIYQIERGYYQIEKKLQALGAVIEKVD